MQTRFKILYYYIDFLRVDGIILFFWEFDGIMVLFSS